MLEMYGECLTCIIKMKRGWLGVEVGMVGRGRGGPTQPLGQMIEL